jgi:hypothetical protein
VDLRTRLTDTSDEKRAPCIWDLFDRSANRLLQQFARTGKMRPVAAHSLAQALQPFALPVFSESAAFSHEVKSNNEQSKEQLYLILAALSVS